MEFESASTEGPVSQGKLGHNLLAKNGVCGDLLMGQKETP